MGMRISKTTAFFAPNAPTALLQVLLLAAVLILPSCKVVDISSNQKDQSNQYYMVSGSLSVNDAAPDALPIEKALVYLKQDGNNVGDAAVTVSGLYGIFSVAPGTYNLCAYLDEYMEYISDPFVVDGNKTGMEIMLISGNIIMDRSGTYVFRSVDPLDVTVTSNGPRRSGELNISILGTEPDAFILSKYALPTILPSDTDTFTVTPNASKSTGVYTATVQITGYNVKPVSFEVQFSIINRH
jgi:hypothetical protein